MIHWSHIDFVFTFLDSKKFSFLKFQQDAPIPLVRAPVAAPQPMICQRCEKTVYEAEKILAAGSVGHSLYQIGNFEVSKLFRIFHKTYLIRQFRSGIRRLVLYALNAINDQSQERNANKEDDSIATVSWLIARLAKKSRAPYYILLLLKIFSRLTDLVTNSRQM